MAEYTVALAQEAKKLGFKFLLNYHYSDTWADPGKQYLPKAWEGKSQEELADAVFEYTWDTVAAFRDAGVMPEMVQPGNEVINGMHWPDGKLPHNWDNFYDIIGQSYYPWWHGALLDLRENLIFMANEYHKDIILVEVAYNCEPAEYRDRPGPFPETPEGQRQFLDEVHRLVLNTPHNRGRGVFWWEPATARGGRRTMFDRNGQALPVITVFNKFTRE